MSSSNPKKSAPATSVVKPSQSPSRPLQTTHVASPTRLFASGDALAAHRAAHIVLTNADASDAQKADALTFLDHCAMDRPTFWLFTIACLAVLAILLALYVL